MATLIFSDQRVQRHLDQLSGPAFRRAVERAFDAPFPLGIPLTVIMAVLTFVHPVKIS
jgi:hypothetical protein